MFICGIEDAEYKAKKIHCTLHLPPVSSHCTLFIFLLRFSLGECLWLRHELHQERCHEGAPRRHGRG